MYDFSQNRVYTSIIEANLYTLFICIFSRILDSPQSRQSAKPFLQSSELGPPHPVKLLAGEGVGSPSSDEGTDTVVLYVYMYFVVQPALKICQTNFAKIRET